MVHPKRNAYQRLIGMIRSPRVTLGEAIANPRSFDLAALIVLIAAACSVAFLITPVGRLAALDQAVRQMESFGVVITDERYEDLRDWQRYRLAASAASILLGWPLAWAALSVALRGFGNRLGSRANFAQVFTIVVHASSVLALRSLVATPLNYVRESLGGATSLAVVVRGLGDSTFAARMLGAIDFFALWWIVLLAMGLGMVYQVRTMSVARWLVGAYAAIAAAIAITQALRGGI